MAKSKVPGSPIVIPSFVNSVLKRIHKGDLYIHRSMDMEKARGWVDRNRRLMPGWQYATLEGQLYFMDLRVIVSQIIQAWKTKGRAQKNKLRRP